MTFEQWKETYDPQKLTSYEEELEAAFEAGREAAFEEIHEKANILIEDNSFNRKWEDML